MTYKRADSAKVLRAELERAVAPLVDGDEGMVVEVVLRTLRQRKMISYYGSDERRLLTTAARILIALIEDPTTTHRALSIYLGIQEQHVSSGIQKLAEDGFVRITKHRNRRRYKVNPDKFLSHPDITRLYDAANQLIAAELSLDPTARYHRIHDETQAPLPQQNDASEQHDAQSADVRQILQE